MSLVDPDRWSLISAASATGADGSDPYPSLTRVLDASIVRVDRCRDGGGR